MPQASRSWSTVRAVPASVAALLAFGALWATVRALNRATRRVVGDSMRPTLRDGDLVLTVPVWVRDLSAGQVVVVRDPHDPTRRTIKRIAATAGDVASLPEGPAEVPRGRVAVVGDDPARSTDSRTYGPVPADQVERHVVLRWGVSPRLRCRPPHQARRRPHRR